MIARLRPSGYVHRWEPKPGTTLGVSRCKRVAGRSCLTTDFPPEARRCPGCFPEDPTRQEATRSE